MGHGVRYWSRYTHIHIPPVLLQLPLYVSFMLLYVSISVLVPLLCQYLLHVCTLISILFIILSTKWSNSFCRWPYPLWKCVNKFILCACHYWLVSLCYFWFRHCLTILGSSFFASTHCGSYRGWRRRRREHDIFIDKYHQFIKFISVQNPHSKWNGNYQRLPNKRCRFDLRYLSRL